MIRLTIAALFLSGCTYTRTAAGDTKIEPNLQAMSLVGGTTLALVQAPWFTVAAVTFPTQVGDGVKAVGTWLNKPKVLQ